MTQSSPPRRGADASGVDEKLLEMGLAMTPAERLRWLEETVEELLPWLGLAAPGARSRREDLEESMEAEA